MIDSVIPDRLIRVLRYVDLVERGGGALVDHELEAFVSAPAPKPGALWGRARLLSTLAFVQAEGVTEYMRTLGWITEIPIRLTDVGRAIIVASTPESEGEELGDGEMVTVLSPEDPLNLFSLTGAIASAKGGVLVEPYFEDGFVPWLIQSTSISRLLLCRAPAKRSQLEFAAGAAERFNRPLEVRCLQRGALHDRYVIGEDDAVSMIGASFNGLHRNFTAIVQVPEPGASAIRDFVEQKWDEAEVVVPRTDLGSQPVESEDHPGDVSLGLAE